jgi:hypothetical protein
MTVKTENLVVAVVALQVMVILAVHLFLVVQVLLVKATLAEMLGISLGPTQAVAAVAQGKLVVAQHLLHLLLLVVMELLQA